MAISLQDLQYLLNKQAAQAKPDAGSQAMMMAAQAARPAGAPPLPKPIDVEDGAGGDPDLDKMLKEKDSELEKAKKENEKLRHDLNKSDLAHQQEIMMRDIEKKEKESLDKIKSEMEALKNEKTMHQAESVQHKAQLDKDTAMAQVKLEQQKSKALIDYNKQQVQEQIKRTDEARKEADRYKDEARKESDRMKDEARSYIDNYRSEVQKNIDAERSDMRKNLDTERATMQKSLDAERTSFEKSKAAISPALDQLMDSTIKTIHSLPVPEGQPIQLKQAYVIEDNNQKLNLFNYYNEQPIEKYANTAFDNLVDGGLAYVPTCQQPVLIKAAVDIDLRSMADDAVLFFTLQHYSQSDDPRVATEYQLLLSKLEALRKENKSAPEIRQELQGYVTGRILSGEKDTFMPLIDLITSQEIDRNVPVEQTSLNQLRQAENQGVNLSITDKPTESRLADESLDLYGFGQTFLPHLVGEKVDSRVSKSIYDVSNAVDLYDERSAIVRGFQNFDPRYYTSQGILPYQSLGSPVFSAEDESKIVKIAPSLSIRNRQAIGNVMSPIARKAIGWNPLDSEGIREDYTSSLRSTAAGNGKFDSYRPNTPLTVQQHYRGIAPVSGNKYVSWQNSATNGWYDTVGALIPQIQQGAAMFGMNLRLPQIPGYNAVRRPTYTAFNKQDTAREYSQIYKDNRFGTAHSSKTPGAQSLENRYKAYNS